MPVPVLYRDRFLCVCEKPVGMSSESPGLPEQICKQTGKKAYPVHRLDQGTGGLVILAFSPAACTAVQELFQQNLVCKEYLSVVSGRPSEDSGCFTDYLFHDKRQNKSYVVTQLRKGVKEAKCEWTLLHSVNYEDRKLSLIRVVLHTGRTHQIRVQFASRGFPLAGDRKYGSRIKAGAISLWSWHTTFRHPLIPDYVVDIYAPPPSGFPWDLFSDCTL